MQINIFYSLLILLCFTFQGKESLAQRQTIPEINTRILFLLDASGSMAGKWQHNTKINIAKRLLVDIVDSLNNKPNLEVGLRIYGHQSSRVEKDCKDTRLEVSFGSDNAEKIAETLKGINPRGSTPIAYSLEKAAGDFPEDPYARNIIILITDGKEGCDGDPCAVSLALQRSHVILKPFIIGLGLDMSIKDAFDCVGTYYDATQEESFKEVLRVVVAQALSNTTAQINLNNSEGDPLGTNVPIILYDSKLGIERNEIIHTLNSSGVPDTILLDPSSTYRAVVYSNPPVEKNNVKIQPGKHNHISFNVPMGKIELKVDGISGYRNLKAIVRQPTTNAEVARQDFNCSQQYLKGKYNLEINTLPVLRFNGIEVTEGDTYSIQVPQPGKVAFSAPGSGYGSIFQITENGLKKIHDLDSEKIGNVTAMQPGSYKVVFRMKNSTNTILSISKEFVVRSGQFTSVKLSR